MRSDLTTHSAKVGCNSERLSMSDRGLLTIEFSFCQRRDKRAMKRSGLAEISKDGRTQTHVERSTVDERRANEVKKYQETEPIQQERAEQKDICLMRRGISGLRPKSILPFPLILAGTDSLNTDLSSCFRRMREDSSNWSRRGA